MSLTPTSAQTGPDPPGFSPRGAGVATPSPWRRDVLSREAALWPQAESEAPSGTHP